MIERRRGLGLRKGEKRVAGCGEDGFVVRRSEGFIFELLVYNSTLQ